MSSSVPLSANDPVNDRGGPAPLAAIEALCAASFRAAERGFDRAFGEANNPLRQLGALGFHFFWIIIATGAYLYAFFDTSLDGAYESVDAITRGHWGIGGLMRSLHRYASDAFVIVLAAHILREFGYGRFRGFRWLVWISGVPLVWLTLAAGVGGYWLVWDRLAQYAATAGMEWFAALPGFDAAMIRNATVAESLNDRFFSLLVFLHIGIPLLLFAGMWVHVQRITQPRIRQGASATWAVSAALVALSVAQPAISQGAAALGTEPQRLALDWFYFFVFPAIEHSSPELGWIVVGAATLALAALPLAGFRRRPPVALVDPAQCNGCGRCLDDCPYSAISMEPRPGRRDGQKIPVVVADLCASCGICAGACPSSTPFRTTDVLRTGIDMPQWPMVEARARLEKELRALAAAGGPAKVVLFGCDHGIAVRPYAAPGVAPLSLPCIGMLAPSFIDYALRSGADGVMVAGCGEGDCEFRFGTQITAERLAGAREPRLRASVPRERLEVHWLHRDQAAALAGSLAAFRLSLAALGHPARSGTARPRRLLASAAISMEQQANGDR
jgi:coenzyme F420-reducing hydrogenase delta subunit/ferredoxin